ncbi:MAG: ATP-binding protein [Candidatus Odinarchaeota archaeon]
MTDNDIHDEQVTKRRQLTGQESKDIFHDFIFHSSDGIILTDEQGIIIEFNHALEQISGWKAEDVKGIPIWDFQFAVAPAELRTPEHYKRIKKMIQKMLRTGQAPWIHKLDERNMIHLDGKRRIVQSAIFPIRTSRGFLLGSILRDITRQKQAEERSDFLHNLLRHDVKNKNTVALGYLQLLKKKLSGGEEKMTEKVIASIEGNQQLIKKIGMLGRVNKEKNAEVVTLEPFIVTAIEENRIKAEETGIVIEYSSIPFDVRGGPLLEELFYNLLENSIKHASCQAIRISGREENENIAVIFEDDGRGIPDAIKPELFSKGFKGKGSSGSGLGLYLIKAIIESYGGNITAKDSELGGARFDIVLKKA